MYVYIYIYIYICMYIDIERNLLYFCIRLSSFLNHHHQLVACLDDDWDLVKIEKLKQVLSIVLKLSIKNWVLRFISYYYPVWQIHQLFLYIYLLSFFLLCGFFVLFFWSVFKKLSETSKKHPFRNLSESKKGTPSSSMSHRKNEQLTA